MIKYFFDLKKLNFRRFIKIDKSLFRKKEKKKVTVSIFQTHNLLKNFKWQPKIYGKKLVKKLYHSK